MTDKIVVPENEKLDFHIQEVLKGNRRFETAAQGISRMILEKPVKKIPRGGRTVYDYEFFREGEKHIVAWYGEINILVNFIKSAAQGESAKEMGIVFVSGPGSGKTFFIDYLCNKYRLFVARPDNLRYTFSFIGLDEALGYHEKVAVLPSITFEDPMILAMNLSRDLKETRENLAQTGFKDDVLEKMYRRRRPMGASTEYLWWKLMARYGGETQKVLEHVKLMPVPIMDSLGTVTGKYSAKDKITSSAVDLLGDEDLQRLMYLPLGDPNKFDLQRGALARVAAGGIHFPDEIFKNKTDLVKIYLGIIQNQNIELDGYNWPIDCMVIASSNNAEYGKFVSQEEESPIVDRFRVVNVGHNTDYKLQDELTSYALGRKEEKTTVMGESMHTDPNLIRVVSLIAVATRIIMTPDNLLSLEDKIKLEAGDTADEKSPDALWEVKDKVNANADVTQRWGQKGLGHRDIGRILQIIGEMESSNEGKCLCAVDAFKAAERVILDYVTEEVERRKYMEALDLVKKIYHSQLIKEAIYNAFMDDPNAIHKSVMNYVNMIVAIAFTSSSHKKTWTYKDPSGNPKTIDIDEKYINAVEKRLGLESKEVKEGFRNRIRSLYAQKMPMDPNYNFMDEPRLVKAVTEVTTESDINTAGSLIGALGNLANEENRATRDKMIGTMISKLNFCLTCAQRTIQKYVEGRKDES